MDKILIVDDDAFMRDLLKTALSRHYDVAEASSGEEALNLSISEDIRLILLDVMMPGMSGHEVCLRLRRNPRTCHTIIVMLTGRNAEEDVIEGLRTGADDYISKPFKVSELKARIDSHLRRQWRELQASPLTGLPGNNEIDQVLRTSIKAGLNFAVCYADLNSFKIYNDKYGFISGDRVIVFTADLLTRAVAENGNADQDFVGHIGGDDFVIIAAPERAEAICSVITESFDSEIKQFYSEEDVKCGWIETLDRQGAVTFAPLLSISIAVVVNDCEIFHHPGQIAQTAAEIKRFLKGSQDGRSNYLINRRGFFRPY